MKRTLVLIWLVFPLFGRANEQSVEALRDSIVCYAEQFLGTPYLYAGASASGFDCTGFVYYVFKHFGISTSRSSAGFEDKGKQVETECALPGDIILFTGTNSEIRRVGHAGIVYQNTDGTIDFIHSSSSKKHFGVTITRLNTSVGYQKRFLRIIDIL
jgi:cell wall-associated NlpC family hydrolase